MSTKRCSRCRQRLPLDHFYIRKSGKQRGQPMSYCKQCEKDIVHESGAKRPMSEAKECSMYLGVHIAERALSKFFDHIIRMPPTNPGFDYICGKGFKIDVKSACLYSPPKSKTETIWAFKIEQNKIADYFLCIGFDNRSDLNPLHVWLIPGELINMKHTLGISNSVYGLNRFVAYEKPLDKVKACCSEMAVS